VVGVGRGAGQPSWVRVARLGAVGLSRGCRSGTGLGDSAPGGVAVQSGSRVARGSILAVHDCEREAGREMGGAYAQEMEGGEGRERRWRLGSQGEGRATGGC
jgi:hypothetical protein